MDKIEGNKIIKITCLQNLKLECINMVKQGLDINYF